MIPHHKRLPADGTRKCPLPEDWGCECDTQDINGMHTVHWLHIMGKRWRHLFVRGDAICLDQLAAHLDSQFLQLMHELGVTPLHFFPGTVLVEFA